jgi:Helix-loop-helix DNA-binding domain
MVPNRIDDRIDSSSDHHDRHDRHGSALPTHPGYEGAADWMARLPSDSSAYLPRSLSSNSPPRLTSVALSLPDFFGAPPASDSGNALWTGDEQADIFSFLNQFEAPWEFNPVLPGDIPAYPGDHTMTHDGDAFDPRSSVHDGHDGNRHDLRDTLASSSNTSIPSSTSTIVPPRLSPGTPSRLNPSRTSSGGGSTRDKPIKRSASADSQSAQAGETSSSNQSSKAPLTAPQKRLNHVKSEKRRRDTIRDGYLTLTKLLSPPNSQHLAIPIPRRGRPKGSGRAGNGSGKKEGKGKSGVLFRAVEYVRFLEENVLGLEDEIRRLEELGAGVGAAPLSVSVDGRNGSRTSYQNGW